MQNGGGEKANPRLLIVAVNYGSDDASLGFLTSVVPVLAEGTASIVMVDNTSRSDVEAYFVRLRQVYSSVIGLHAPTNLGYLGGARYGLDWYRSHGRRFDYLLVCNVDLRLESSALTATLSELSQDDLLGVVAPSIVSSHTASDLNPFLVRRPKAATMHAYAVLFRYAGIANLYRLAAQLRRKWTASLRARRRTDSGEGTAACAASSIYAPHGSCMVFAERYFERGGTLDYPMFLFSEEIFVAEQAAAAGLRVLYEPRIVFSHDDHASTGLWRSRRMCRYAYESARYVADTYFSGA